jgi:U3 small nucleolar RNA-associated protein 19
MPGLVDGTNGVAKRKRAAFQHKSSKRARSDSVEESTEARILLLESEILDSKKNYNNIPILIKYLQANNDESVVAAVSLCRIFTCILAAGDFDKKQEPSEKEAVVRLWLRERYSEFKKSLFQLLGGKAAASTALTLCMRMLKSEGTHLRNGLQYFFPATFLKDIIKVLLIPDMEASVRHEFGKKYLEEYDDVRFFTFHAVE